MAIPQPTKLFYEFGPFRINSVQRVLLRDGEVVAVTPKQFDLLLLLVENHGRVVEKERLIEEVWPETAVEEGNLTTNIYMLRKLLGEDANRQQYIQTLPRRGYRFVGEVREVMSGDVWPGAKEPAELHLVTRQEQEAVLPREALMRAGWASPGVKWRLALAAVALLVLSAAIAFWIWGKPKLPASAGGVKTIAVLPFKPLSAESRDESLEVGMAETLINKLIGIRQFMVQPISSVRKYNALDQNPIEAGQELGVDYVLEGNLQMDGDKTRATVRLWSVKDRSAVWSDMCDKQCSNLLELQDAIASRIARTLAIELTLEEKKQLARHYTESTDAYRAYLRGRDFFEKRTPQARAKSIEYLEEATRLDPNYGLAYATLANNYLRNTDGRLPDEAKQAVARALEIDNTLAEAHAALGNIRLYEGDWSGAESAFIRARDLNPNYQRYHLDYAHYLRMMKRFEESVAESKRVLELDPLSALYNRQVALALYFARRYDEAIEQCGKTLDLEPGMPTAYRWLAKSYEQKGLYGQAVEAWLKTIQFTGLGPGAGAALREAYAASGWKGFWRKALDLRKGRAKQGNVDLYVLAEIYARLGDKDQAFFWLKKDYEQNNHHPLVWLNCDPFWDDLRSDRRYIDLVRRMGLDP